VLFPRKGITTLDHVVSTIPHQVNIWFVEIVYEYSGINLHPRSGNKEFLIKRDMNLHILIPRWTGMIRQAGQRSHHTISGSDLSPPKAMTDQGHIDCSAQKSVRIAPDLAE
jgi:hypothetical protein